MKLHPSRQVHLDFHTTELIDDIGGDFDAREFARTVRDADINSMTVFARCHHGWLYYDSERFPERVHPALRNRNLLLEQVRALHEAGVRAPVYITVQWDYYTATRYPQWLVRKADGSHEGAPFTQPGFYQSLCVNTGYRDFLREQTAEVCRLLGDELDGVFFDIVGIRPCLCAECRARMRQAGVDMNDDRQVRAFAKLSLDRFKDDMTKLVRSYSRDCTIFYNAGHVGPCTKDSAADYTHFELESLPSGGWGYLHFPVTARYARKLGKDCIGMTGKFHTSWGDFHSLKNKAALEFEAFRMLSFGFGCSIGDQLEPRGALNPATYKLIGSVYSQFKRYEPWARPSKPLIQAAVMTNESPLVEHQMSDSILGAVQMLEELAVQFDIVDRDMDIGGYELVIVPEDVAGSPELAKKLDEYAQNGGAVIACGKGALYDGRYPACFGADYAGERREYPDFILAQGELAAGLEPENEYVIYMQGSVIEPGAGRTALSARAPYFAREGERFCSHRYTPSAKGGAHPAAVKNGRVILFSHPLFWQYRNNAPRWVKLMISNAMDALGIERYVSHDGPSSVSVQLLEQAELGRVNAHVLTYIPVRKSATIDIIEERTPVYGMTLRFRLPNGFTKARLVPDGTALEVMDGCVTVPKIDGYAVIELS